MRKDFKAKLNTTDTPTIIKCQQLDFRDKVPGNSSCGSMDGIQSPYRFLWERLANPRNDIGIDPQVQSSDARQAEPSDQKLVLPVYAWLSRHELIPDRIQSG